MFNSWSTLGEGGARFHPKPKAIRAFLLARTNKNRKSIVYSMKKILVKKRSGRLEPFDSRKMSRAVSRTGVPYPMALDITSTVKNSNQLADKEQVSSITLRKIVSEELRNRGQEGVAESYEGYKKRKSTTVKFGKSQRHASKVNKSTKTHAKQSAKTRGIRAGKTKLSRTTR